MQFCALYFQLLCLRCEIGTSHHGQDRLFSPLQNAKLSRYYGTMKCQLRSLLRSLIDQLIPFLPNTSNISNLSTLLCGTFFLYFSLHMKTSGHLTYKTITDILFSHKFFALNRFLAKINVILVYTKPKPFLACRSITNNSTAEFDCNTGNVYISWMCYGDCHTPVSQYCALARVGPQFYESLHLVFIHVDINISKNIRLGTVPESVIILREQFLC